MQFIAPDPVHVHVRGEFAALYDNSGRMLQTKKRRVHAKFQRGLPGWAVPIAVETFDIGRIPPDFTAQNWFAMYDSELDQQRAGWTDEERQAIEEALQQKYIKLEVPEAELPYPAYLKHRKVHGRRTVEMAVADIVAALKVAEISTENVIAYEADHRDSQSDAIISGVLASFEPEPEPELIEA